MGIRSLSHHTISLLASALAILMLLTARSAFSQTTAAYEPWRFSNDPLATLWKELSQGRLHLDASDDKTFLRSLLQHLHIPVESQVLVFSKTSLQNSLISPATPRALYFNEHCYVGWVQGGMIEVIAVPTAGEPQFYAIDPPVNAKHPPALSPSEQCFSCHESSRTHRVKGPLVRSVFTDANGQPLFRHGSFTTTPQSPFSERWGGWYVTGRHGHDFHMGNLTVTETASSDLPVLPREKGANLTSLASLFPTAPYLTGSSDLVALMVLEHQCAMQNILTAAGNAVTAALQRQRDLQEAFGQTETEAPTGTALAVIQDQSEKILQQLLFCGEYALKDDGVEGDAAFQDAFRRKRRETADGRSLKDFQLRTRLFKYRCSYMIYARPFTGLPEALRTNLYGRLHEILTGPVPSETFVHLSASERHHIAQILQETIPELAACWRTLENPPIPAGKRPATG